MQEKPSAAILAPSFTTLLCHVQASPNTGLDQESNTAGPQAELDPGPWLL